MSLLNSHRERIPLLNQLGLSKNESLVYLSLLESGSSEGLSGYEIAARAEVPRSAVYTVLESLVEEGAVSVHGKPQKFFAVPPKDWLRRKQHAHHILLDSLLPQLKSVAQLNAPRPIWIIRRYRTVLEAFQNHISGAKTFLALSVLPSELEQLTLPSSPNFPMIIHCPASYSKNLPGSCWVEQNKVPETFNRLLLVDGQHLIQGHFSPQESNEVIRSDNPSLYETALCAFEQRINQAADSLAISAATDTHLLQTQKKQLWLP
ncbi:MAG: TrmB family transcriptional regulator [Myxococcota bacterium]